VPWLHAGPVIDMDGGTILVCCRISYQSNLTMGQYRSSAPDIPEVTSYQADQLHHSGIPAHYDSIREPAKQALYSIQEKDFAYHETEAA
jgi:hypothetical protein